MGGGSLALRSSYKYILLGAGLANCLLALRFLEEDEQDFLLVEAGSLLGGHHTWSFYRSDISEAEYKWIQPLLISSWQGYQVRFPEYELYYPTGYCTLRSDEVHQELKKQLQPYQLVLGQTAELNEKGDVCLGRRKISGEIVFDGRGADETELGPSGYQKFVGLDLRLSQPHGLKAPIIMDATVEQKQGFRFVYCLPFDNNTLLVEDTRYSRTSDIDEASMVDDVLDYARCFPGKKEILRQEKAALPIPMTPRVFAAPPVGGHVFRVGLRGGMFHPVTGYSFPLAMRFASVAKHRLHKETTAMMKELQALQKSWQASCRFYYLLNRMMFGAAEDHNRIAIFARFYRLPLSLIENFYRGELTLAQKLRLLSGRPPVPIHRAVGSLLSLPSLSQTYQGIQHGS